VHLIEIDESHRGANYPWGDLAKDPTAAGFGSSTSRTGRW
jgi:hypothetical protein